MGPRWLRSAILGSTGGDRRPLGQTLQGVQSILPTGLDPITKPGQPVHTNPSQFGFPFVLQSVCPWFHWRRWHPRVVGQLEQLPQMVGPSGQGFDLWCGAFALKAQFDGGDQERARLARLQGP